MDLKFSEEHENFRTQVQAFLKEHKATAPTMKAVNGTSAAPTPEVKRWQKILIENGYTARTIPKEYGGYGGEADLIKGLIIQQEFIAADVSTGLTGQGISMLVPTLLELGTEEQKQKWVGPTIRGEVVWCQGYSEPGAGSDLASLKTKAVVEGDQFVINGQKIWTSSAQFSDMCFILVRTEPDAPKHHGISYLLMPMTTPGIEVRPLVTITGDAMFNEMFLTDVKIGVDQIVDQRGKGWMVANATLKHERGMIGNPAQTEANLNALMKLMKAETCDDIRAVDMPVYRDRLMRLQGRLLGLKLHSLRLLSDDLNGKAPDHGGLIVKYSTAYLNHELYSLGVDVMGELGTLYDGDAYQSELDWQKMFLGSFSSIIGGGTAQIQKNVISERGLGMPREPRVTLDNKGWAMM